MFQTFFTSLTQSFTEAFGLLQKKDKHFLTNNHQTTNSVPTNFLTNFYYDFYFHWQTEKNKSYGITKSLFLTAQKFDSSATIKYKLLVYSILEKLLTSDIVRDEFC